MNEEISVEQFNKTPLNFLKMLNGRVSRADRAQQSCEMTFELSRDFCHSGDIVQGGFITAMLDATMSHTVFTVGGVLNVATLEIKVSFLEASRAGSFRAVGHIIKSTYKTAFLEGRLYNADGVLTATASSVAKLVRPKTDSQGQA